MSLDGGGPLISPSPTPPLLRSRRFRTAAALAAAAITFALIPLGVLPIIIALPVMGLLLALGAPPDTVPAARPLARNRRNAVLGVLVLLALAVVALQPRLLGLLLTLFGIEQYTLVVTLLAVAALALPLAMAESTTTIEDLPADRFLLARRNLMLALTVLVTLAMWYAGVGQSFLVLAALVLGVPVVLAVSRIWAARRGRVEARLWRHPMRAGTRMHRLQLLNVVLLCLLLAAATLPGTYDALRLDLSAGGYRAFQIAYVVGLIGLVLLALVPLRRVYLGTNLLVVAISVFVAVQLVVIYRPAADQVTISSPLAAQWYVGQGGHAELINYHQVTSTQSDALDILRVVDGRTHRATGTDLTSYYIFGLPVLAPADGVVTFVVDGHPDQKIGTVDNRHQAGNHLIIDIGGGRYVMMGHLHRGSIRVKVGDRVRAGQQIAQVGNSGNTSQPHLHIQAQNQPSGIDDIQAVDDPGELVRTLHTFPLVFRDVTVTRGGSSSTPGAADLRRGDLVQPAL